MTLETTDAPLAEEAPVIEGELVVEVPASEAPTVEAIDPPEEPKAEAPAPKDKPKGPTDSILGELTAQRARRREAESKAQELERRLADAQTLLERLSAKDGQPAAPKSSQTPTNVNDEIVRQVALKLYERDIAGVVDRGQREFGASDFNAASQRFAESVGDGTVGLAREIMDIAGEKSHKVIFDLSQDLDRALAIRDMPQTRRILAINEMANMAEAAPKVEKSPLSATAPVTKTVSKAPTPAPAIRAGTTTEKPKGHWWSDKTPDDEFDRNFWENQKTRRGMRR